MRQAKKHTILIIALTTVVVLSSARCSPLANIQQQENVDVLPSTVIGTASESALIPLSENLIHSTASASVTSSPLPPLSQPQEQRSPSTSGVIYYAQAGDSLKALSSRFALNTQAFTSNTAIPEKGFLAPGQKLIVDTSLSENNFHPRLIPDSEVVYSPSAAEFDTELYVLNAGGYLTTYSEFVPYYKDALGWEVIQFNATSYSINPRLLLSLLEYSSGWVFNSPSTPEEEEYPLGLIDSSKPDLHPQVQYAAQMLSEGYYSWRRGTLTELTLKDGTTIPLTPTLNAGTVGLMYFFSTIYDYPQWENAINPQTGFTANHKNMFGDYWERAAEVEPLLPAGLTQPDLILPFEEGQPWIYSSGPHGAWSNYGALAAIDFAPVAEFKHCAPSEEKVLAAADGVITRLSSGLLLLDLDKDENEQTGWVLLYLHLDWNDDLSVGQHVEQGEELGVPSCLGGKSTASHIHIARKYNGEWIEAGGPLPFTLSGWTAQCGAETYEGTLSQGDQTVTACFCGNQQSLVTRDSQEKNP